MRRALWQNVAESAVLTIAFSMISPAFSHAFSLEKSSIRASDGLAVPTSAPLSTSALSQTAVDLELSLLIDVSGSVDSAEYKLQMQGYQKAFTNLAPQFEVGAFGKVAVNAVLWSGATQQQESIPWFLVSDRATALQFADLFAAVSRPFAGMTAPGSAISFAAPLFASNAYQGKHWVVDVSGDGRQNDGVDTALARTQHWHWA